MIRSFRLVAVLVALCPLAVAGAAEIEIPNPGFEQGLTGWRLPSDERMSKPVPEAAASGKLGIRVTDEDPSEDSRLASPRLTAKPGTTYTAECKARVLSGHGIGVFLYFYDAKGERIDLPGGHQHHAEAKPELKEWGTVSVSGKAPENADTVEFVLRSNRAAVVTADFDDFRFRAEP